jgi:uncharacterized protein with gpF-like domain
VGRLIARDVRAIRAPARPTARGVRANLGVAVGYERRVMSLVKELQAELLAGVRGIMREAGPPPGDSAWRASDGLVDRFKSFFGSMIDRWRGRWERMADEVSAWFGSQAGKVSERQFVQALREAGFVVKVGMTDTTASMMERMIKANVDLIKTIPGRHLAEVRDLVDRGVMAGRDLGGLEADLLERYDITARRARVISKDQNNKATQALSRVRAGEAGITRGIWQHMRASTVPRPTHELMDGSEYDLAEGLYDPEEGRKIQPAELVNCNCECRWVIPGVDSGFATKNRLSEAAVKWAEENGW